MYGETPRRDLVPVTLGDEPADIVVSGGTHVNVHSGELREEDVAIRGDRIAAVGDVEYAVGEETTVIDAEGKFVTPGLIEGHLHTYHSMFNGTDVARLLLEHGTTVVADGFYGPGNVAGLRGIEFAKAEIERTPLSLVFLVPTLSHTQMSIVGIPRTDTALSTEEVYELLDRRDCRGLEEPTYEPIVDLDEEYLDLFEATLDRDKVVTGHAAMPGERELQAYIAAGCSTEHEATTKDGAVSRARRGMYMLSRYGTGLPNLEETVRGVTETGQDSRRYGTSGDVRLPADLLENGCIDVNVRAAIENGVDPVEAVQMATLNTAEALRVDQDLGSVAPGKVADVVLVDDLADFSIDTVLSNGEVVVEDGEFVADLPSPDYPDWTRDTIRIGGAMSAADFVVEADGTEATVRTIELPEAGLVTEAGEATLPVEDGAVRLPEGDPVVKAAMVDRLESTGRTGVAFVDGFGLDAGALGMSYNAIRENVIVAGVDDDDMAAVVNRIADLDGGVVAVKHGEPVAEIPLPIFGIQSDRPIETVVEQFAAFDDALDELGCTHPMPLFSLEFHLCPYPETPGVRITDHGLFHVGDREPLDLFV
ncbi:MAG: adenine deaminase C-terminal domain-containing protein [Salinigranum sp.]